MDTPASNQAARNIAAAADALRRARDEMAGVYVPLVANTDEQRKLSEACQDVRDDCLAVLDRHIGELER